MKSNSTVCCFSVLTVARCSISEHDLCPVVVPAEQSLVACKGAGSGQASEDMTEGVSP